MILLSAHIKLHRNLSVIKHLRVKGPNLQYMDFLIAELYLFDKFISIGTHIIHSVPVHGKIGFKCFMFLQQALKTKSQVLTKKK